MLSQNEQVVRLAKLVFEMARDVEFLLNRHVEPSLGPMGGEIHHPTAQERASELRTTLDETRKYFEAILPTQDQQIPRSGFQTQVKS